MFIPKTLTHLLSIASVASAAAIDKRILPSTGGPSLTIYTDDNFQLKTIFQYYAFTVNETVFFTDYTDVDAKHGPGADLRYEALGLTQFRGAEADLLLTGQEYEMTHGGVKEMITCEAQRLGVVVVDDIGPGISTEWKMTPRQVQSESFRLTGSATSKERPALPAVTSGTVSFTCTYGIFSRI